jgi:phospholipid/cholesterol/gamma-HCH transport system ATP-binding protein
VVFQSGALLGSYTVGQNIALPLEEFTNLPRSLIDRTVRLKLDLVRLGGYGETRPGQLSGGMRKRAALARAMALDPEILLCDEPSAGLDPGTALQIDELLMELNASLGVTVVVVTHDLTTLEHLAHRCVMLNGEARGIIAAGSVDELRGSPDPRVQAFFGRPPACQETPR